MRSDGSGRRELRQPRLQRRSPDLRRELHARLFRLHRLSGCHQYAGTADANTDQHGHPGHGDPDQHARPSDTDSVVHTGAADRHPHQQPGAADEYPNVQPSADPHADKQSATKQHANEQSAADANAHQPPGTDSDGDARQHPEKQAHSYAKTVSRAYRQSLLSPVANSGNGGE